MIKKNLLVTGAFLVVVLVGAGGFWGGITYQLNKSNQVQERFLRERGGQPLTGVLSEGQLPSGNFTRAGLGGGGTMGEVKSISGNVMTLSTAQDVTTVNLSDSTHIIKSVEGTTGDLQPGVRVMVTGERDEDGNLTANQITIISEDLSSTRTAP